MTSPAVFGYTPIRRDLQLSTGADFILDMSLQNGVKWPENTRLYIKLSTMLWEAEVFDGTAYWKIESAVTDTVPEKVPYQLFVVYPATVTDQETTDLMWFYGKTKRTRLS